VSRAIWANRSNFLPIPPSDVGSALSRRLLPAYDGYTMSVTEQAAEVEPAGRIPPPSVSVIIPTHNRPELLHRAVSAAIAQNYAADIDIIVVHDKCEPHDLNLSVPPGRSIRQLRNARQPGLPGARNTGLLAATGDLVAFCDDDDEWLPGKLHAQVDLLTSTGATVVGCGITLQYGERTIARDTPLRTVTFADLLHSRVAELHPSTVLARRANALADIGLVDEEIPGGYCEDYDWLLRAARIAEIPMVLAPGVRVNWMTGSLFSQKWDMISKADIYLLAKHPEFATSRVGTARLQGQIAFAQAALGHRREAFRWALRALRHSPREKRGYLALAISARMVSTRRVLQLAHDRGRGI
jgi:GT2 family glycosyltransferase